MRYIIPTRYVISGSMKISALRERGMGFKRSRRYAEDTDIIAMSYYGIRVTCCVSIIAREPISNPTPLQTDPNWSGHLMHPNGQGNRMQPGRGRRSVLGRHPRSWRLGGSLVVQNCMNSYTCSAFLSMNSCILWIHTYLCMWIRVSMMVSSHKNHLI